MSGSESRPTVKEMSGLESRPTEQEMTESIKRPVIPAASSINDWPTCRKFAEAVKTAIELHEGYRGPDEERFVKLYEIADFITAEDAVDNTSVIPTDDSAPSPPTNFSATKHAAGGESSFVIYLSWTNATDSDLSYVEIVVATSNNRNIGHHIIITVPPGLRGHIQTYEYLPPNPEANYYFWIRSVDQSENVSNWNPDGATAGLEVHGETSLGEWIDRIMEILRGASAPAYDPSKTYYKYDVVSYMGHKYMVYNDNSGAGIIGIVPTNTSYWRITGLVLEGLVDGIATVGIDGRLVVDQTIYARSIVTDGLIVGENITIADGAIHVQHIADTDQILNSGTFTGIIGTGGHTAADVSDGSYRALLGFDSSSRVAKAIKASILTGKPTASDLWLTADFFGYYDASNKDWPVFIANNGEFYFGLDENNYFARTQGDLILSVNQENALRILNGGGLTVYDGGDITLICNSLTNPSDLEFKSASHTVRFRGNAYGNMYIYPVEAANSGIFLLGYAWAADSRTINERAFGNIYINSGWGLQLRQENPTTGAFGTLNLVTDGRYNLPAIYVDAMIVRDPYSEKEVVDLGADYYLYKFRDLWLSRNAHCDGVLYCGSMANFSMYSSTGQIYCTNGLILQCGSTQYSWSPNQFRPNAGSPTLGASNNKWPAIYGADIYGTTFHAGAGGYLDNWINPETKQAEDIDDLDVIDSIQTTGEYDTKTGFLKIDHSKAHPVLFSRNSLGEIETDSDGTPYYNISTQIGVLVGAVRALHKKIKTNEDDIKGLKEKKN